MSTGITGIPNWNDVAVNQYGLKRANSPAEGTGTEQQVYIPTAASQPQEKLAADTVSFGRRTITPDELEAFYKLQLGEKDEGGGLTTLLTTAALAGAGVYALRKGKLDGIINKITNTNFYKGKIKGGKIEGYLKTFVNFLKGKNAAAIKPDTAVIDETLKVSSKPTVTPKSTVAAFHKAPGLGDVI